MDLETFIQTFCYYPDPQFNPFTIAFNKDVNPLDVYTALTEREDSNNNIE